MLLQFIDYWDLFHKHVVPYLDVVDMMALEMSCVEFASRVEKQVWMHKKTYSALHQTFFKRVLAMNSYRLDMANNEVAAFRLCCSEFIITFKLALLTTHLIFDCGISNCAKSKTVKAMPNGKVLYSAEVVGNTWLTPKWTIPIPRQRARISNYIPLLSCSATQELLNVYLDK